MRMRTFPAVLWTLTACGSTCGRSAPTTRDAAPAPPKDDMVLVAAGPFLMGDPPREVDLPAFRIDRTEVTRADYDACVAARACAALDVLPASIEPIAPRRPVGRVTRAEAVAYCAWVDKKLPTEAQWEKAARGTDGRRYPWGNAAPTCTLALFENWIPERVDTCGEKDPHSVTHDVGSHPAGASPYGALDMASNVLEWTSDNEAHYAVVRGGRVLGSIDELQTTYRKLVFEAPDHASRDRVIGFRCARDARRTPELPSP